MEVVVVLQAALLWHTSKTSVLFFTPLDHVSSATMSPSRRLLPSHPTLLICAEVDILKHTQVSHLLLSCKQEKEM